MLYRPWSYRNTIGESPISLKRICVLSYLCLLLTKVLFETSLKSFQYNTKGRRLSNYSIKLILCSHCRSRYKGLCQNKKHEFDQYTKGGHFCAAHMALKCKIQQKCLQNRFTYTIALITVPRRTWAHKIRCDTRCTRGVNVSESATNGQYGLTLKKVPQPQHTRMNIGGGMGRK